MSDDNAVPIEVLKIRRDIMMCAVRVWEQAKEELELSKVVEGLTTFVWDIDLDDE